MSRAAAGSLGVALLALSCAGGPTPPAELDLSGGESCRWCRMAISDQRTAAQVVAPLQDPVFFDDIGCLRDWLQSQAGLSRGAIAYVADHRTGVWLRASEASFTRTSLATPMGSGLIAHDGAASRDADPASAGGGQASAKDLFGPGGPPDGREE